MTALRNLGKSVIDRHNDVGAWAPEDHQESVAAAARLLDELLENGQVLEEVDGVELVSSEGVPYMAVRIDRSAQRAYICSDTYEVLVEDDGGALEQFYSDIQTWSSGMKYMVQDGGKYTEAARRAAQAGQEPGRPAVDPITALEAEANNLVVQAAGLNREPSPMQLAVFGERLGELQERHAALEERMRRAKSLIGLAATAVADMA